MDALESLPTHLARVSPHGYSWFEGLLRNPRSGVQTPQVLWYSGMRVALNPRSGVQTPTRWSNPPRSGVRVPHVQSGYTLTQISGRKGTKNHPTHMGQDTRGWTMSPIGYSPIAPTHPANYRQKAAHGGKTAQITGRAQACAVVLVNVKIYK